MGGGRITTDLLASAHDVREDGFDHLFEMVGRALKFISAILGDLGKSLPQLGVAKTMKVFSIQSHIPKEFLNLIVVEGALVEGEFKLVLYFFGIGGAQGKVGDLSCPFRAREHLVRLVAVRHGGVR